MEKSHRLEVKRANLNKALAEFTQYCSITAPSKVERAGTIQGFEFTFELFWKFFRAFGVEKGYQIDSPRDALSKAVQLGLIGDSAVWVQMLKDRNETSHIYNEAVAFAIHDRAVSQYLPEFEKTFRIILSIVFI